MPKFRLWFHVGHYERVGDLKSLALNERVVVFNDGSPAFTEPRKVLAVSKALTEGDEHSYELAFEGFQTPFFVGPTDSIAVF